MEHLGFADIAKDTLLSVQKDLPDNPGFWFLLAKTAFESQDPDLLVSAMASAYKLRPDDPMIINNYAAAWPSTRQRPDEALTLTARLLEQLPDNPGRLINHSLALLQNRRLAEAESILRRIEARPPNSPAPISRLTITSGLSFTSRSNSTIRPSKPARRSSGNTCSQRKRNGWNQPSKR